MRILISSESYWPNKDGGAVFEHALVHQLAQCGHQVAVVAPGQRTVAYKQIDGPSTIYRTPSVRLPLNPVYKITYSAMPTVRRVIREFRPDVIHVNTMWLTGASLLKVARQQGIPIVATNHLMPENVLLSLPGAVRNSAWLTNQFWRLLARWHNKFDAVTSPTPSATRLLQQHGLTKPLYDISNGVDTVRYAPPGGQAPRPGLLDQAGVANDYAVYFGRVNKEKRLDMLVRGFAAIAGQTTADLVIAGVGNAEETLAKLITELGLTKRVHLVGFVSDDDKVAIAQCARLFAITSPAELQSIVCLEAMACGLPIVAVDVAALSELCHDGQNGYLVRLDDVDGCGQAMLKLLCDPALRDQFGRYSRSFVAENHSFEATWRRFTRLYECATDGSFPVTLQ